MILNWDFFPKVGHIEVSFIELDFCEGNIWVPACHYGMGHPTDFEGVRRIRDLLHTECKVCLERAKWIK